MNLFDSIPLPRFLSQRILSHAYTDLEASNSYEQYIAYTQNVLTLKLY